MKKVLKLIFVLVLAPCMARAGLAFDWVIQSSGSGTASGQGIAADTNGNIYVAGSFRGTVGFGSTNLTSAGGSDIFVAKFDNSGNLQWIQQAGGTNNDQGAAVAVDASGNVFVTG